MAMFMESKEKGTVIKMFGPFIFLRNHIGKPLQRNIQRKIENIAYNINPDLGNITVSINKSLNNIDDKIENVIETIDNSLSSGKVSQIGDKLFKAQTSFELADHLYIYGVANTYTHHGLYVGNNKVLHYSDGEVKESSISDFCSGKEIYRKNKFDSPITYEPNKVIFRAYSRVGENQYNLLYNNCENFVRWCRCGDEIE
jgi:hypothetical protein